MSTGELYEKYKDNPEVAMFIIYQREAHAGEMRFKDIEQPTSMEERLKLARSACSEDNIEIPVLVDGINNDVAMTYGRLPNSTVVINKKGIIVEKQGWADSKKTDEVLAGLLK
jgi:hypothetical protein